MGFDEPSVPLVLAAHPAAAQEEKSAPEDKADVPFRDVSVLPDAILGRHFQALLDVINSGDRARVDAFTAEHYGREMLGSMTAEQHAEFLWGVWEGHQGLDLHGFRTHPTRLPENFVVGILKSRSTGTWRSMQVRFDPQQDYRITSLMIVPGRPPEDVISRGKLDEAGVSAELTAFLDDLASRELFSGAILLARGGRPLVRKAYGEARREFKIPNKVDTRFNLGSMNKMFTAVAIAQLVEKGLLSYDDTIGTHLPEGWVSAAIGSKVRIHHLLTHTSGLGDYLEGRMEAAGYKFASLEDYKSLVATEMLAFEPGSKWAYSNTGFLLLGVIIQNVTGQDYYDHIRKNIYGPAGMTRTDHFDIRRPVPDLATGYHKDEEGWLSNTLLLAPRGTSAGGGFSTVDDLLKFQQALQDGKLVSRETLDLMGSPKRESSSAAYGYGFMIMGLAPDRIVGHGGSFPGVSSMLAMYLDSGWTFAALCNGPGAQEAFAKVLELIERASSAR